MSEKWEGFTDEDLERMRGGGASERDTRTQQKNKTSKRSEASSTAAANCKQDRKRAAHVLREDKDEISGSLPTWDDEIPVEERSGAPSKPVAVVSAHTGIVTNGGEESESKTKGVGSRASLVHQIGTQEDQKRVEDVIELSDDPSIQHAKLEELQKRQKEIEEQNKQKKAALQKTINERFQRSQQETAVLKKVKSELSKLDNAITSDVAILRNTIDQASRDYTTAKARYDVAESEFVAAKVDLFKKSERKEMLTQHLYTIIQESELRKAKRLEDLTKDLATMSAHSELDEVTVLKDKD